jgi:hypothetical protein
MFAAGKVQRRPYMHVTPMPISSRVSCTGAIERLQAKAPDCADASEYQSGRIGKLSRF